MMLPLMMLLMSNNNYASSDVQYDKIVASCYQKIAKQKQDQNHMRTIHNPALLQLMKMSVANYEHRL